MSACCHVCAVPMMCRVRCVAGRGKNKPQGTDECALRLDGMSVVHVSEVQGVPHAVALGLAIPLVVLVGRYLYGHVLHNLQSVGFESYALHGVVGEQAHLVYAEMPEHLRSATVVALIGLESEVYVGVYRVVALLLQLVGGYLVHEPYAASFLLHVYHHAFALLVYHLHGLVQLFAAVAAFAAQYVARGA